MLRRLVLGVGFACLAAAGPLAAQDFEVGPRLGYLRFKEATGIEPAGMLGLDAMYRISSRLGVGVRLDVSRPGTDGKFFAAEMSFAPALETDTTLIFAVEQPLTLVQYQVQGLVETGGAFSIFAKGSAGGYTITLDPQVARGRTNVTEWGFSAGGGLRFSTGGGTAVQLEVQDVIFTNFRREDLNPVEPRFRPQRFPDVVPLQPEFDGTAHNLYVALSFSFTPGGAR